MEEVGRLQTLGKYELVASIGQGGMANVYLALVAGPAGFNKLLVIKVLREDVLAGLDEGLSMFLDEARISALLVHPNIVHTYEVGEFNGRYFIAMEYLDGQSYRSVQLRSRANGGIPIHEELRIIAETARGLHYSHQLTGYDGEALGVVHRDVSPQNVFITYDGQIKLLDFGIAKTSSPEHLTQVGVIKGKLDYMAPEQLRGEHLDGRADIFSLGAMLWEAITGKRFAGGRKVSDVTKVHARIAGEEPNVRTAQPEVPEELAVIVDRALALKPEERWPDASSLADALDAYVDSTLQKPTAKSLSQFVAPLFEEERQKMRRLVEQQVEKVKQRGLSRPSEQTSSLPRLRFGDDSTSGMFVGGQESLQLTLDGPRSLAPLTQSVRTAARKKSQRRLVSVAAASVVTAVALALLLPRAESKSIAADSSAASGTLSPIARTVSREATQRAQPAAGTTSSSHVVASAPLVALEVTVSPRSARVTLDGAPLEVPFSGEFRQESALHHLEVSADGFRSVKQLVAFSEDQTLNIVLERLPARPSPARRAHASAKNSPSAQASVEKHAEPAEAAPPKAPAALPATPGMDLKSDKPRVVRRRIDALDPYSTSN